MTKSQTPDHKYRIFAPMDSMDIEAVKNLLTTPQNIVIVPHKNPDGDAIGSSLGLYHYLKAKGQDPLVIVPNDFPKFLKWMPGTGDIVIYDREYARGRQLIKEATVIFTLDFNHLGRVDQMGPVLETASAMFVMIDHHQEPADYADITYSDPTMGSTCEMVYDMIEELGDLELISPDIANCLYTGILTDSGSFKFASTTSRTLRVAANLIDRGAENTAIHHRVYDTNSPNRLHLLGTALGNMVILKDYATAYTTLSQTELDAFSYEKGDTEGFVNYGLTVEGIRFAAIFIENLEEGILKISFRSVGDFSVNDFARKYFEGGGHINAAGGRSTRSIPETTAYFESLLPKNNPLVP